MVPGKCVGNHSIGVSDKDHPTSQLRSLANCRTCIYDGTRRLKLLAKLERKTLSSVSRLPTIPQPGFLHGEHNQLELLGLYSRLRQPHSTALCINCRGTREVAVLASLIQQGFLFPPMTGILGKDLKTLERRISQVANHLITLPTSPDGPSLIRCSITSAEDSYRRIHGQVPTHEAKWRVACDELGKEFTDIIYEKAIGEGIAKITINRPEKRNAFRPQTIKELIRAFNDARDDSSVGVVILTGKGTKAFCSGGDQALRTSDGYIDYDSFGRLNVLDLQIQIRRLPKPVIAMVAGYAVGGGHVLHMVCDLTIAADNAIFGQTGPKVGSFDAGYGSSIMSHLVGPKKAREMWFLSKFYSACDAEKMGLVNIVVPLEKLEQETLKWCREILRNSPTAIRVLKSALNAVDDGQSGLQELGGNATFLFYGTEEAKEGKTAYLEGRRPDFSKFPRRP